MNLRQSHLVWPKNWTVSKEKLRRIFGLIREEGTWRIYYNQEIYNLYKQSRLSTHMRLLRLQWMGYIQRMQEERVPKKIIEGKPGGKRPVGKPKARWVDNMEADVEKILRLRHWRRESRDREVWRRKIGEAKARFEL